MDQTLRATTAKPSTVRRIDVLYRTEDLAEIQDLLDALEAEGLRIAEPVDDPPDEVPLVVLITEAMVRETDDDTVRARAQHYRDVLPVSFLPGAAPFFEELSQSLVRGVGVSATARRIATVALHGGQDIVAWNRLTDDAIKWSESRATASTSLLRDSILPDALRLLQSTPAESSPHLATVRAYVTESSTALASRRRRWGTTIACVATALVVLIAFAAIRTVDAQHARTAAERADAIATADRLSRDALRLIGADPDLPSILIDRAIGYADTDVVRGAAAAVASATWPHSSHRLDYIPRDVDAAKTSDRIAVTAYYDTTVRVYESAGGRLLGTFDYHEDGERGGGDGRMSPNGSMLATTERLPGPIKVFDVDSGARLAEPDRWRAPDDRMLGWWDDAQLLVARGPRLLRIEVKTGAVQELLTVADDAAVKSASRSPNGDHLAVATDTSVLFVDGRTFAIRGAIEAQGVTEFQMNDDGDHVLAVPDGGELTVLTLGESAEKTFSNSYELPAREIIALDELFAAVGHLAGELSVVSHNDGENSTQWIRAHTAGHVRVDRLRSGQVVTVALDQFLRVWDAPDSDQLGKPTAAGMIDPSVRMTDAFVDIDPIASARNQIRHTVDDLYAVTLVPGYARVFERATLSGSEKRYFFSGLNSDVFLSDNGKYIVVVGGKDRVRVSSFDDREQFWGEAGKSEFRGKPLPMAIGMGKAGLAAVSDDGATVVIADEKTVSAWHMSNSTVDSHDYDPASAPVVLGAAPDGKVTVVTANGRLRDALGAERNVPGPIELGSGDRTIAAGEYLDPGHLMLVTTGGELIELRDGETRIVGAIGAETKPFAVCSAPKDGLVSVMTHSGVMVLDIRRGTVVFGEPARGRALVTDVAFTDNAAGLVFVTEIGTVRTLDFADGPSTGIRLPRAATTEELTAFSLDGGQRNG
ncbi:WD40 repeat domain-containing protein [Nocardia salmonicida]|uniref:WD40 repeat domain-containing protein n=1 Tax=Nocardia salmonicida TaxID=53431 RepID=UPI00364B01A6